MLHKGAVVLLLVVACSGSGAGTTQTSAEPPATASPAAPTIPDGDLDASAETAVDELLEAIENGEFDSDALGRIAESGDPRTAWLISDMLRFFQRGEQLEQLLAAYSELTGSTGADGEQIAFVRVSNELIGWDIPAWDGYVEAKARLYTLLESNWRPFFDQDVGKVDWRLVTWGGVLADTREFGSNFPCNCIPALDNPETTPASEGDWYPEDRIVFGIVVGGEALALPKHQMEVHEMVNLTIGGRELGIPYCTLCGSAQAYFTDDVPGVDRVVLRTSGLLSRSNKMMYDRTTGSLIDTFTGTATTGVLAERDIVLEQATVVASTWGDWKSSHPETRILARDGGIDRVYRFDPLGDRDANGPIFPVGPVDPRLPVQELVVGLITPDGEPIAFPTNETIEVLEEVEQIEVGGVTIRFSDGIRAFTPDGEELPTHQAFWFAWSQFHPNTEIYGTD